MNRDIDDALAMGEERIAAMLLDELVRTSRKMAPAKVLEILRARARLAFEGADDDDLEDLGEVARKHAAVTKHDGAVGLDHDALAWAELMAGAPRKAKRALSEAERVSAPKELRGAAVTRAALRYAEKPGDGSYEALVTALRAAPEAGLADRIERVVRLLVQRQLHSGAALAAELVTLREASEPRWGRSVARAVDLRVAALRVDGERERADAELARWIDACEDALPDPGDPRRANVDARRDASTKGALWWRARRLERVARRFGDASPLLEPALYALSADAVRAREHAIAVDALRRLDLLLRAKGAKALVDRACVLLDLRRSFIGLGRTDEAGDIVRREEEVRRARGLPVPDHLARAEVRFAAGDLEGFVDGHFAELARCEAGTGPAEGPQGTTTRLVRAWTRLALERAGRGREAARLVD